MTTPPTRTREPAVRPTISRQAEAARLRAGLSVKQAAELLRISPQYLRRLERGGAPISWFTRERMRKAYGSFQPIQNTGGEEKDTRDTVLRDNSRASVAPLRPATPHSAKSEKGRKGNQFAVSTSFAKTTPEGDNGDVCE